MTTAAIYENIDIGRVLQRGFATIGRNALAFFGVAVLLVGVPVLAMFMLVFEQLTLLAVDPWDARYWTAQFALVFVAVAAGCILQAAVVRSAILDLGGRNPDIAGSLVASLMRLLPLIGLAIACTIGIALGLILLVVPGIILYLMWIVAVPVMIEERRGIFDSLSRSAELAKGSKGQIFGLVVILGVLAWIVSFLAELFSVQLLENPFALAAVTGAVEVVNGMIMAGVLASLYVELRTIKEGASADSLAGIFE
jgi:hypothetical protein